MKIRVVRDADVDYGWQLPENRRLSFSERFAKVYGVPPELVRRMRHEAEIMADVLEYDDAAES